MKYVIKADDSFHNENDTIKAMNICKKSLFYIIEK
jgi:hypothetical protein